jgi:hypothetical protein
MFELVLSVVGVAFAVWALLGPASTEQIRATLIEGRTRLQLISVLVLLIALAYPFVSAMMPADYAAGRDLSLGVSQLAIILLLVVGAITIWPNGRWDEPQLRSFHARMESMILTDRAAHVVDVLDRAFPSLPTRRLHKHNDPPITRTAYVETFDEVLADALVHVEFIRAAARHNRRFLAKVLSVQSDAGLFASDQILTELMFGPDRILPRELAATTNFNDDGRHRFHIPDRCLILHALFDDIAVADETHCWKPIGDGVIRHIASQADGASADPDQRPFVEEYEKSRWTSPVGCGIWFFRLMATSAAMQGHTWHMWLPYLAHFIDEIDNVLEIPASSANEEFPNAYCYWISDCLTCCNDVIQVASKVGNDNPNRPSDANDQHSVVAGALYTYGLCLESILKSKRLSDQFKHARVEGLCLDYSAWEGREFPESMSAFAVNHLTRALSPTSRTQLTDYIRRVVKEGLNKDSDKRLLEALLPRAEVR